MYIVRLLLVLISMSYRASHDNIIPFWDVHEQLHAQTGKYKSIDDKFILSNYAVGLRFVCQLFAAVVLFSNNYILVINEIMLKFMTYVFRKLKMLVYNLMETLK